MCGNWWTLINIVALRQWWDQASRQWLWPVVRRIGLSGLTIKLSGWYQRRRLPTSPPLLDRFSPEREVQYWKEAEHYHRVLASYGTPTPTNVPLVWYYKPTLLPEYRIGRCKDAEAEEYYLPPRAFCKWHRMTFRGPLHPTSKQAESLIKHYSSRDRRMMHRIARMLTDEEVFMNTVPWTSHYKNIWRAWLESKGPDVAIVFG